MNKPSKTKTQKSGVIVFPSLHYIISQTSPEPGKIPDNHKNTKMDFGIDAMNSLLPAIVKSNGVVMIQGAQGTFKSALAINFLFHPLWKWYENSKSKETDRKTPRSPKEAVLFIHFSENPYMREVRPGCREKKLNPRLLHIRKSNDKDFYNEITAYKEIDTLTKAQNKKEQKELDGAKELKELMAKEKGESAVFCNKDTPDAPWFIELDFKSGAIFPEEFMAIICSIFHHIEKDPMPRRITRVVLDDVSAIGASYPFLHFSKISEDKFLSAFVHLMRHYEAGVVMTGTTGNLQEANVSVSRACALADTIVTCRFLNVFGENYVVLFGEGLAVGRHYHANKPLECAPPVVRIKDRMPEKTENKNDIVYTCFELDTNLLTGLVGLETGEIKQPGLLLRLYEEGEIHKHYNKGIRVLLCSSLGANITKEPDGPVNQAVVSLMPFGAADSEAVHESLTVLEATPLDKTVLTTLDEFSGASEETQKRLAQLDDQAVSTVHDYLFHVGEPQTVRPYYGNVLLLAWRKDLVDGSAAENCFPEGDGDKGWGYRAESWAAVCALAENLRTRATDANAKGVRSGDPLPQDVTGNLLTIDKNHVFWADLSAEETLSCALMDAIVSAEEGEPLPKKKFKKFTLRMNNLPISKIIEEIDGKIRAKNEGGKKKPTEKTKSAEQETLHGLVQTINSWIRNLKKDYLTESEIGVDNSDLRDQLEKLEKKIKESMAKGTEKKGGLLSGTQIQKDLGEFLRIKEKARSEEVRQILLKKGEYAKTVITKRVDEVSALHKLLMMMENVVSAKSGPAQLKPKKRQNENKFNSLPPDAGIYLCWYSQLRELFRRYPYLADKLDICALPGRGFTGDWYLGLLKGSVNLRLGQRTIETLTEENEEYKRFAHGVGLPTRRIYFQQIEERRKGRQQDHPTFLAWPGADKSVTLNKLLRIHNNALSRGNIRDYLKFRVALYAVGQQLGPMSGRQKPKNKKDIGLILKSLPFKIAFLAKMETQKTVNLR